jgi:hypothetical protein
MRWDRAVEVKRSRGQSPLLALVREVDPGFDVRVFIDVVRHLARYCDVDRALGDVDVAALRAFFQRWITELDLGGH